LLATKEEVDLPQPFDNMDSKPISLSRPPTLEAELAGVPFVLVIDSMMVPTGSPIVVIYNLKKVPIPHNLP